MSHPTSDRERGASVVEYAFVVLLIAIIAITAVNIAGDQVSENFSAVASSLTNANNN